MGADSRHFPNRRQRGSLSTLAFRSHNAVSTAEMALDTMPGRPRFRHARIIASDIAGTSVRGVPTTAPRSWPVTTASQPAPAYVQPSPSIPPPQARATTTVVASHAIVASASGWSVGTV